MKKILSTSSNFTFKHNHVGPSISPSTFLLFGIGLSLGLGILMYFLFTTQSSIENDIPKPKEWMNLILTKASEQNVPTTQILNELRHVDLTKTHERMILLSRNPSLLQEIYHITKTYSSDFIMTLMGFKLATLLNSAPEIRESFNRANKALNSAFKCVKLPYVMEWDNAAIYAEPHVFSTWFNSPQIQANIQNHFNTIGPEELAKRLGKTLGITEPNIHIDNFFRFKNTPLTQDHIHSFLIAKKPSTQQNDTFVLYTYLYSKFSKNELNSNNILSTLDQHYDYYDTTLFIKGLLKQFKSSVNEAKKMHLTCGTNTVTTLNGNSRRCYVSCETEFVAKQIIEDVLVEQLRKMYETVAT